VNSNPRAVNTTGTAAFSNYSPSGARFGHIRAIAFIAKTRLTGRTEIDEDGDVSLSLVIPERYRYDMIGKITTDAKKSCRPLSARNARLKSMGYPIAFAGSDSMSRS
jgi:hypothetical protein